MNLVVTPEAIDHLRVRYGVTGKLQQFVLELKPRAVLVMPTSSIMRNNLRRSIVRSRLMG